MTSWAIQSFISEYAPRYSFRPYLKILSITSDDVRKVICWHFPLSLTKQSVCFRFSSFWTSPQSECFSSSLQEGNKPKPTNQTNKHMHIKHDISRNVAPCCCHVLVKFLLRSVLAVEDICTGNFSRHTHFPWETAGRFFHECISRLIRVARLICFLSKFVLTLLLCYRFWTGLDLPCSDRMWDGIFEHENTKGKVLNMLIRDTSAPRAQSALIGACLDELEHKGRHEQGKKLLPSGRHNLQHVNRRERVGFKMKGR